MIIPSLKQIDVDVVSVVPKMVVAEKCKSYSFASKLTAGISSSV